MGPQPRYRLLAVVAFMCGIALAVAVAAIIAFGFPGTEKDEAPNSRALKVPAPNTTGYGRGRQ